VNQATLSAVLLLAVTVALPTPASADLRSPLVPICATSDLQNQIDILGNNGIDVTADQLDLQRWGKNISGFTTLTLSFELDGNPAGNAIGVYNAVGDDNIPVPASEMFEIFPSSAQQDWYAVATFSNLGTLSVTLFDHNGVLQPGYPKMYANVDVNDFSFYVQNGATIAYAQDALNPGNEARALVFRGTDQNEGGWYMCFSAGESPDGPENCRDFSDAILFMEAVKPVPVNVSTWGAVKARYR